MWWFVRCAKLWGPSSICSVIWANRGAEFWHLHVGIDFEIWWKLFWCSLNIENNGGAPLERTRTLIPFGDGNLLEILNVHGVFMEYKINTHGRFFGIWYRSGLSFHFMSSFSMWVTLIFFILVDLCFTF